MKKIVIAATIAISSIALVACSSQDAPTPTVTVTQTAPAIPTPVPDSTDDGVIDSETGEELYLIALKSVDNPILNVATDGQLLQMGYSVCDALNAGFTVDDIISYMANEMFNEGMTSDTEVEAVGSIIGAAESALCVSTF